MMRFRRKAPSSVGLAADLSPRGEAQGAEARLSLRGRGRHAVAGEGTVLHPDCAIWNDITRALDAKPRGAR